VYWARIGDNGGEFPALDEGETMNARRHPHVVNVDEVDAMERPKGRFAVKAKRLGAPAGARGIGCNWMELQPGKTSFPFHYHTGIEEGLFILAGSGELRIGTDPTTWPQGMWVQKMVKDPVSVDYFEGEDTSED
jgi:uncharacterized cupin superfamily protein